MKSAIAFLTPEHPKRWGVAPNQSPLLSTVVSRQAMTMDYQQIHQSDQVAQLSEAEIARQWRAFDIEDKNIAVDVDAGDPGRPSLLGSTGRKGLHRAPMKPGASSTSTKSTWATWLSTPARVFRSATAPTSSSASSSAHNVKHGLPQANGVKKAAPKKRSSWLPDPNNRWPQGW
ncbi:hypothetical protein GOP47_0009151 [Adiantum capillus-veneris]|uniref:Uncharacterized protein n=1 Tax=Adiantum capillus-veneris TaxID=13818 RepID=A0A9D4UVP4_ADICA|nr:hypothetical protein GOP47_0009151 [Adiantum capillus-veneris]